MNSFQITNTQVQTIKLQIKSNTHNMPAFVQVFMSRDASKYLGIDSWTTVKELRQLFANSIGLEEGLEDFKIAEHRLGKFKFLKDGDKVVDVIKDWPKVHCNSLWFVRYYWVTPDGKSELQLLSFFRIQNLILSGDVFITPSTAFTLAAMELQRRLNLVINNVPKDYMESNIKTLLPDIYISEKDLEMTCAKIRSAIAPYIGISPAVVVSMLHKAVKEYGWYRKTFIKGTFIRRGSEHIGRPVFAACDIDGFHILFFPSMDKGGFYPYNLINSYGKELGVFYVSVDVPGEGSDIRCYFKIDEDEQDRFIKMIKGYLKRVTSEPKTIKKQTQSPNQVRSKRE